MSGLFVLLLASLSLAHVAGLRTAPAKNSKVKLSPGAEAKEATLAAQMRVLLSETGEAEADAGSKKSAAGLPVPQPKTSPFARNTCKKLFAYKDNRDLCFKLQKRICGGRNCTNITSSNSSDAEASANATANCEDVQKKLCQVPILNKTSHPIKVENGSNVTTTFCNAYMSKSFISIQHDKYYALADPWPFVPRLPYLSCVQAQIPPGQRVNVYLGHASMTKYTVGTENSVVLLGQYTLGEQEMGITTVTFKDEGYQRPILCSAFPVPHLAVQVYGRDWHPFSDADHAKAIGYMECEKLSLDHADSVHHPEILDFFDGKEHKGELEIDPTRSIFLIGAMTANLTADKMLHKSYSFDHLKSVKWVKKYVNGVGIDPQDYRSEEIRR